MYSVAKLVQYAEKAMRDGVKYLFGCNMEVLTQAKLDALRASYPQQITDSRYAVAKAQYIGKVCTDCSGLIFGYYPKYRTTAQLYSNATQRKQLNRNNTSDVPVGAILWRDGHVGIYVGNGYEIEARGFDYGIQRRKVSDTAFTHYLLFNDFDYQSRSGGKLFWVFAAVVGLIILKSK